MTLGCSWPWSSSSKLPAGEPSKQRVCSDWKSYDVQTIHIVSMFPFISTNLVLSRREDAVLICKLVGGTALLFVFLFHWSAGDNSLSEFKRTLTKQCAMSRFSCGTLPELGYLTGRTLRSPITCKSEAAIATALGQDYSQKSD